MILARMFCSECAARLPHEPPVTCPSCGTSHYANAKPCGGALISDDEGGLLLVKRAHDPYDGCWDIPGGFCDLREHPRDAAVREAREELGVTVRLGELVGMYMGEYQFQDEILPVLDCIWRAEIVDGTIALDPAEASEYTWAELADPPPLAFATMDAAVADLRSTLGPASWAVRGR